MLGALLALAVTVADLNKVTRQVNRQITYMTDRQHYGVADKWVTNPSDNLGDCEDYALTKRDRLLRMGVPASAMQVDHVRTPYGPHAVLKVTIDGKSYVLDSLNQWAIPAAESGYYGSIPR